MSILYRSSTQLTPGDGRTVFGVLAPFGTVAEVSDSGGRPYLERFAFGCFERTARERVGKTNLLIAHDHRRLPVGRCVELREEPTGLYGSFLLAETADGNDALAAVKAGVADSFSVGFAPIRHRWDGDILERTEVALREVSLTGTPAYETAEILGTRSQQLVIPKSLATARFHIVFDW